MKIYTRSGDEGKTSLFAGGRVSKSHLRVEAYGTVDELNSFIGLVRASLENDEENDDEAVTQKLDDWLRAIQSDLFVIGADLATPMDSNPEWLQRLAVESINTLEERIDTLDADLEPLKNFILPGGTLAAAQAHVARTVCRRTERLCVALAKSEEVNAHIVKYLNRLSDFLFTLARWLNADADEPEVRWSVRR